MRLSLVIAALLGLVLSFNDPDRPRARVAPQPADDLTAAIDRALAAAWAEGGVVPAPSVDDLTLARRLWLDLLGTIPSLEEVRRIEALPAEGRRRAIVAQALGDDRFAPRLAELLARAVVGWDTREGDLTFRRRRLVVWLTRQLEARRGWDAIVRDLIAAEGSATGRPAVNFVIAHDGDPEALAARTTRAFLGTRLDCAQCHDHPYARWTQADFRGLAAHYGRLRRNKLTGVRERRAGELRLPAPTPDDPDARAEVAPAVPFDRELLPEHAPSRRAALAAWVTHPDNRYFSRAIANRLWQALLGAGVVEPVDELDTGDPVVPELLAVLAGDLRRNGFDLVRLVEGIVSSRAYGLGDATPAGANALAAQELFARVPLRRLRGDQLTAAAVQVGSLRPYDARRAPPVRLIHTAAHADLIRRYGDDLATERPQPETLLQRIQLLAPNAVGQVAKEQDGFGPAARLASLAGTPERAVEVAFLITLTRRPRPAERERFVARVAAATGEAARKRALADLLWALINTTEFAWSR